MKNMIKGIENYSLVSTKSNLIYLIGFMGSGKSYWGKRIAKQLGYQFIDLDDYIEKQQNLSIKLIFKIKGETFLEK